MSYTNGFIWALEDGYKVAFSPTPEMSAPIQGNFSAGPTPRPILSNATRTRPRTMGVKAPPKAVLMPSGAPPPTGSLPARTTTA